MDFHAHPIEIFWSLLSLAAAGVSLALLFLAVEDRAYARLHAVMKSLGAGPRLRMASSNLWSEMFRFTISVVIFGSSLTAIFSQPASMVDFGLFPQTLASVIAGILVAALLVIWGLFDLSVRRNVAGNGGTEAA